jgi:TetR/AcrR family transcriptional regulator, cholesterol catabolism regulator
MKTRKPPAGIGDRLTAQDIFLKAAEIFATKGYDATSMDDLARALEVTKAGLYYYIDSKEDLLFGIMSRAMDWLDAHVTGPARAESDAERRLRSIVGTHGRELLEGARVISILSDEVAALTPRHRRHILDRKRSYFDLVRGTLDDLKAAGRLRAVDTTVATFGLFGALMWLPRWYRPKGRLSVAQILAEFEQVAVDGLLK